jgi:TRAP-type C4-dicarboxylate transport system permease small subunit
LDVPALLRRIVAAIRSFENVLLVVAVLALIALAAGQIIARAVFGTGWVWLDPLTRALVLWAGLLGAVVAARDEKHINLDALTRQLSGWPLRLARLVALGAASVVSGALAWYSLGLIALDREGGTMAFGPVPTWWVQLILPLAFGLMALRFAIHALLPPPERRP